MPRKKNQTKRGKSSKNSKSRKRWMNNLHTLLNTMITNLIKYWNSGSIGLMFSLFILTVTLFVYYKPSLIGSSTHYLARMNPVTLVFPSAVITETLNANNLHHHPHPNVVNSNNAVNQFCRIQSTPAPPFQRQVEAENKGYVEFQGCRIMPDGGIQNGAPKVQTIEEKDIGELMAQLQSNAIIGDSILSINTNLNNNNNIHMQRETQTHAQTQTQTQSKKEKKKHKKDKKKSKKKKKTKIKKIEVDYADTDRLRELDEMNEFGIDADDEANMHMNSKDNKKKHSRKQREKHRDKSQSQSQSHTSVNNGNAWKPRRIINQEHTVNKAQTKQKDKKGKRDRDREDGIENDTEIDVNLMGMYQRGASIQLSKMHYTSDAVYEHIMEDISQNGISQSDIYHKYHIDFIPDESSFRLKAPPSMMANHNQYYDGQKHNINSIRRHSMKKIERKMAANRNSKAAFKNFYALTRMQQKYLGKESNIMEDDVFDDDLSEDDEEEDDDEYNMNILRDIVGGAPLDVLSVVLNDDQLPQWLYESDTILDLNCGIGDALIHLLSNFSTIKGICIVGTNNLKYKYAQLNVAQHGLADRIEIIHRDMYSPYVASLYNVSDVIYIDWYSIDEEYVSYFARDLMNNADIRSAKPGRVILSYNKLLFDESVFQPSYTLHFAAGWKHHFVHDVSMYMYSIPFYLSKLSNLYVQNYQVFYGFEPLFEGLFDDLNDTQHGDDLNVNAQMSECMDEDEDEYDDDEDDEEDDDDDEEDEDEDASLSNDTSISSNDLDDITDIFRQISFMKQTVQHTAADNRMFSIITGMNIHQFDDSQHIWNTIASQFMHQSLMSTVHRLITTNVESDNTPVLLHILTSYHDRHTAKQLQISNNINMNHVVVMEDEWTYLEDDIFPRYRKDSCFVYRYIGHEWHHQLSTLLNGFHSMFFYESVKDSVEFKMESLFEECDE